MSTPATATTQVRRSPKSCWQPSTRQYFWSIAFGVTLALGTAILRYLTVPAALRYLAPAIPLLAGLMYMRAMVHDIRLQVDELQLRIYLQAAAVVVGGLFIVMLTYPLLEVARLVGPLNSYMVLVLIALLGIAGYISASRRYR
jgi:hypothetical protein